MKNQLQILMATGYLLLMSQHVIAQCQNFDMYASTSAPSQGNTSVISYCNYMGEWSYVTGIVQGNSYTASIDYGGCITVSDDFGIITHGMSPVTFTATSNGIYYFDWNTDCVGCGSNSSCATTQITNNGPAGGGGGTPNNCEGAIYVCSNESFSGNSTGFGIQELNASNRGCLTGNEHQSSWYYITVETGGTIEMLIQPANNQDDYDFAIWGPFDENTAPDNCPPTSAPVRCSWADGTLGFFNYGGVYYGIYNDDNLYYYALNRGQVHSGTGMKSSYYHAGIAYYGYGSGNVTVSDNSENDYGDGYVTPITASAGDVYILVIDNFSSSSQPFDLEWGGTAVLSCTDPIVLSVELLSFTGRQEQRYNVLRWETLSEKNNDYFEIERSVDGSVWNYVGKVNGYGTTSESHSYQLLDGDFEFGMNYYRLNQIDFDGKRITQKIISIDNSLKDKTLQKIVNYIGQEVDENYKGVVLYIYTDGTVIKKMQ